MCMTLTMPHGQTVRYRIPLRSISVEVSINGVGIGRLSVWATQNGQRIGGTEQIVWNTGREKRVRQGFSVTPTTGKITTWVSLKPGFGILRQEQTQSFEL